MGGGGRERGEEGRGGEGEGRGGEEERGEERRGEERRGGRRGGGGEGRGGGRGEGRGEEEERRGEEGRERGEEERRGEEGRGGEGRGGEERRGEEGRGGGEGKERRGEEGRGEERRGERRGEEREERRGGEGRGGEGRREERRGGEDPAGASSLVISNNIVGPEQLSATATNWVYSHSQFQEVTNAGAPSPTMVKVTVHHPPEANVKIHHVQKVPDSSPALQALESSMSSGSAGAPAPAVGWPQIWGGRNTNQQFKYCFSEVKNGRCSSRLRGLRSKENCCRGFGKAWGDNDQCVLCPQNKGTSTRGLSYT
ncbi:Latent-transforming growth factor beta-binding protein 2 [Takifugu flavidus]|uniref:Latent-transforming growth factor beta-binding protein 2 n=1 Tax=Takifugu flavidus TaxID=433684 RepID=A0A5C6PH73_9TELE|nr:Latent-transforming growth factor beta-binding protein 2 [Takifugu flavidus]